MGKEFFAAHDFGGGRRLEACNWNDNDWEDKRIPTRADLDRISTEVPIVAQRICGHVVVVNSAGLRIICRFRRRIKEKRTDGLLRILSVPVLPSPSDDGKFFEK